jgi:hypothetical protein
MSTAVTDETGVAPLLSVLRRRSIAAVGRVLGPDPKANL